MTPSTSRRRIPTGPFVTACTALGLATALLAGETAAWSIITLFAAILVRLLFNALAWPLPSQPLKLLILAAGSAAVLASYGSVIGIEAGLGILIILVALKLLETSNLRDFQVLVLLGYFLALCDLFFAQDLAHWLMVALITGILTVALIHTHAGPGSFRGTRLAFTLTAQALPIILLLYLFFPRVSGGFRIRIGRTMQSSNPISERLEPGSVAAMALLKERAFRVTFPDGNVPPESELYWRGVVLWRGEGLTWVRAGGLSPDFPHQLSGRPIHQIIVLEPHGETWLCALDHPDSPVPDATYQPGNCIQSIRPVLLRLKYEIESLPENRERRIPSDQLFTASQKPAHVSPAVQALVDGWKSGNASSHQVIHRALEFFRTGHFQYSLTPGSYLVNPMDDFLFHRRIGFCEHYAAAFASLMRVAGIPSRVIVGYHGGTYDGSIVEVNQSDAHAWCEVWLKGEGWQRIDPTTVIAPERISEGMEDYLTHANPANSGASGLAGSSSAWRAWTDGGRLLWNNLCFQWDLRVLNYNRAEQNTLLARIGFGGRPWNQLSIGLGAVILAILAALALWLIRPARRARDAAGRSFERFCSLLAAAGVPREPWEGPVHFSERAAGEFPSEAEKIRTVGQLYAQHRYGKNGVSARALAGAVRALGRLLRRR